MDIECKSAIRTWIKHLFLDIFSTNSDTLVPSLYQCFETCSIEVSWPLLHLHFNLFVISKMFAPKVELLYATNTSQHQQQTYLSEYPLH
jgi:hypothetical protein